MTESRRASWASRAARSFRLAAPTLGLIATQASGQSGVEGDWIAMLDTCSGYAETGKVASFDGWRLSPTEDGRSCEALATCASPFVALVREGATADRASITVSVGAADLIGSAPGADGPSADSAVGDAPRHFSCTNGRAFSTPYEILTDATEAWVADAQAQHRLAVIGRGETGTIVMQGCGFDGRPYTLAVVAFPGMFPQLSAVYPAQPETRGLDPSLCGATG
ncbi:hypothetical protein SAMN04488012_11183 [Palleronia salina]|uniref:Uncharacterized protein n=1 Tax=Palleronia salina TaxID=313368 RepID=A0A1M6K9I5_9RHOB|nr:hypothetical protein [Palleronia salina]SHJ55616.1 hypothetical protein SAMN04488012_11183 [Palleronia salina]